MCSGCGRCGKMEGGHYSATVAAPSVGLVQVAGQGNGFQTNMIAAPTSGPVGPVNLQISSPGPLSGSTHQ
jgi:hypothetical protein